MPHAGVSLLALSLLAPAAFAQVGTTTTSDWRSIGADADALPGRIAGTKRYNVTFKTRSFDLNEYRAAIVERQPAAVVQAIVRDLEQRARQDQEPFRRAIEGLGGNVNIQFWLINAASIEIPEAKLPQVRAMANVLFVTPDLRTWPETVTALPMIRVSTDAGHHNADAEQALGNKGTGVGLAIIDTSQNDNAHGVNLPHMGYYRNADRNNHTAGGMDGSRLLANVAKGSQPANNSHPHGTGVAGIAAGAGWNTVGADAGHASDANIIGYSICDTAGSCGSSLAIEAAGWQQAAADKATYNISAANMSYTSSPSPLDVSQQAIDACATVADILPCTAAANTGPGSGSTTVSSSTANGIAVAAVDSGKVVASFSSRGPLSGDTARFFPDIAACGVNTVMPQFGNETADWVASGTSMASPQATGLAGLVKSANPTLNAREMKAIMLNNTESIQAQNPSLDRNAFGVGFMRDDLACNAARAGMVLSATINSTTTPNTHSLPVVANQNYAVTLVFHRHVLTSTAWSDLNLAVRNGAALVATSATTRNLYEKVEFTAAVSGTFTIEVSANSLEIANLPYSLAFGPGGSGGGGVQATYTTFGTGCLGTGSGSGGNCNVVPSAYATAFGNSNNNIPFSWTPTRYQQVFLGSELPAAFVMNGLGLRQDDQFANFPGSTVDLEMSLGYSTLTPATLTTTFANNFNVGAPTTVLARTQVVLPQMPPNNPTDPTQFFINIPWSTPFPYTPNGNNLVLQVVGRGNSNGNAIFTYPLDAASGAGVTTSRLWGVDTATTGTLGINYGMVMCFRGGPSSGAVPLLSNTGTPRVNNSFSVNLAFAKANTPALLFFGLSNSTWLGIPLPLNLAAVGAPGCTLLSSGEFPSVIATNAGGGGSVTYPLPNDSTLLGARFYNQYVIYDPTANGLGFVTTRGGQGGIGNY